MRLRHRLELRLQLAKRELELLVDLAIDGDLPGVGVLGLLGNLSVVADEEFVGRRGVVVKQMLRRSATSGFSPSRTSLSSLPGNCR